MGSKDSDQTGQMPDAQADLSLRCAHRSFVGFVMLRLIYAIDELKSSARFSAGECSVPVE